MDKNKKEPPPGLPVEEEIAMLKKLLAGGEVKAITPSQKEAKAALLRGIADAAEHGYQLQIPYI